jgi:predicted DCC family thiol-disulfide oxidoreductase YuxK
VENTNNHSDECECGACPTTPSVQDGQAIVLFDGFCEFCNKQARFTRNRDKKGRMALIAQDSDFGNAVFTDCPVRLRGIDTMYFISETGDWHVRSAAVVRILLRLGLFWKILAVALWWIPLPLRDLGYRVIANSRNRVKSA